MGQGDHGAINNTVMERLWQSNKTFWSSWATPPPRACAQAWHVPMPRAPGAQGRNVDHFCLRIEPFNEAALIAHLQTFSLTVAKAESRFGAEGKGLSLYCFDPDGNQVELKGPPEA